MNRKYIVATAVIFAFASIFSLITVGQIQAQVQATPACPVGYTCTPVTPVPVPAPVPTSDAKVTVNGRPTLVLTYDSKHGEAALTATFSISVNGGKNGINIYKIGGGARFIDQKGVSYSANSISSAKLTPQNPVIGIGTDNYGQTFFIVPAGRTVNFQAVVTADPRQLFAGTYHSSLISIWANPSKDLNNSFNLQVPANNTNGKTIIGEVSPYITSVTPNIVSPGQKMTIQGQRLNVHDAIYIDNALVNIDVAGSPTNLIFTVPSPITTGYNSLYVNDSITGASNQVSFQVQSSTTPPVLGTQIVASLDPASPLSSTVQISTSAQTNNVPLAVFDVKSQGGPSTLQSLQSGINVTLPYVLNQGLASALFSSVSIRANGLTYYGTFGGVGKDGIASFNNFSIPLPANASVPVTLYGSVNPSTNSSLDGSTASASLLLNSIVAIDQNYNTVPVSPNQGFVNGNTITFSSGIPSTGGVQVSNTSSALGAQNCTALSTTCVQPINFAFTITAGNNPIYLSNAGTSVGCPSGYTCTTNGALVFNGKDGTIMPTINGTVTTPGSLGGDGTNYFIVPPGSTRSFTYYGNVSNSGLPAGVYTAQVIAIQYGTSPNNLTANSITSGLQNLQVSVSFPGGGSTQPSIHLVASCGGPCLASTNGDIATPQGNTFSISGTPQGIQGLSYYTGSGNPPTGYYNMAWFFDQNFGNNNLCGNNNASTNGVWTMSCSANVPGSSGFHVDIYANGQVYQSNKVNVTVVSSASTTPQPSQPPVISGGAFPTTLSVGQTGTWTINASDPQNGSLSYSVDWGDSYACPAGYTCTNQVAATRAFVQSSTFTHSYSTAGTYTITFIVQNAAGLTAQTSTTVQVGAQVIPPPTPIPPTPVSPSTTTPVSTKPSVTITSPIAGTTVGKTFAASGACPVYSGNVSVYYYASKKVSMDIPCLKGRWATNITLNTNTSGGSFTLYATSGGQQATVSLQFVIVPPAPVPHASVSAPTTTSTASVFNAITDWFQNLF